MNESMSELLLSMIQTSRCSATVYGLSGERERVYVHDFVCCMRGFVRVCARVSVRVRACVQTNILPGIWAVFKGKP